MDFEFYTEPFDITKPPPAPPNRDFSWWPIFEWVETRKSKKRTREYTFRLDEYANNFQVK